MFSTSHYDFVVYQLFGFRSNRNRVRRKHDGSSSSSFAAHSYSDWVSMRYVCCRSFETTQSTATTETPTAEFHWWWRHIHHHPDSTATPLKQSSRVSLHERQDWFPPATLGYEKQVAKTERRTKKTNLQALQKMLLWDLVCYVMFYVPSAQ